MGIAEKFIKQGQLEQEEYPELLNLYKDPETVGVIRQEAVRIQKKYFGNKIYTRGLVEFTNYCRNDCYYCGIRRSNTNAERYRLTKDERMIDIIKSIKQNYPDCAITLSIGEKSKESYRKFREAGADRYLLRHETADEAHYRYLHPENLSLSNRKQCLYDLKELGYQIGAGFMVGAPGQTMENLAEDLVFLKKLNPHMAGIGPFIPHHDTKFAKEEPGSVELTLFLLSVIRIMLPKVLLPATTALGTLDPRGREKGFQAGANVVMSNLSPVKNRKQYELYDNKICTGEEAAECRGCLSRRAESVGYEIVTDRGDSPMK